MDNGRVPHRLELSRLFGLLVLLLGMSVIAGHILRLPELVQVIPQSVPMVLSTAVCFLLASIPLLFPVGHPRQARTSTVCGSVLALAACTVLTEHLANMNLGLDWPTLHTWVNVPNPAPGRMAPNTALGFLVAALALLLLPLAGDAWRRMAGQGLAFLPLAIGLTSLAGYALQLELLYTWYKSVAMAVPTALGMVLLSIGLFLVWSRTSRTSELPAERDITFVGVLVLTLVALTTGFAGFAQVQGSLEHALVDSLMHVHDSRSQLIHTVIENAVANAAAVARRPGLIEATAAIETESCGVASAQRVNQTLESILAFGFSGLALYDTTGRLLRAGGAPVARLEASMMLGTEPRSILGWSGRYLLETRLPVRRGERLIGWLLIQQPLPKLEDLFMTGAGFGSTGEMALCTRAGARLLCLPQQRNPRVYTTPSLTANGDALPMSRAISGEAGVVQAVNYRGDTVLAAIAPIYPDLGLVVQQNTSELYAPIRAQLNVALPLLLTLVAGGVMLLRAQVRPLAARLVGAYREITEKEARIRRLNVELEERVRRRTADLEASNKELEAFAYSISHDLRAPLRAIDGFSRKVIAGYGDRLDAEGRRQLQVVRDSAQRMGRLIDDLLAFSRMGRREMQFQPLDMDALLGSVTRELRAVEPERAIELAMSPLPAARGDAAMLRQVWLNLLGNALKFTRHRQRVRIEVSGCLESGEARFCVKDNGAGFDMQFADKLFGVFQRLHRQDEFEGTGVGLAIAQRIVHRHGGRIWAEGKPDEGASFWFALPAAAPDEHRAEGKSS